MCGIDLAVPWHSLDLAHLGVVRRPADARRRSNVLSHGVRDGVEQVRAGANAIVVHPQHVQALRQLQLTSGPGGQMSCIHTT